MGGYGIGIAVVLNVAASWLEVRRRTGGGGLKCFTAEVGRLDVVEHGESSVRVSRFTGALIAANLGYRFGLWKTQSVAASLARNVCQGWIASGLRAGEH